MRYHAILTALTPISHNDTRTGVDNATNMRIFMQQPTNIGGRLVYSPHITENSLRSILVRYPLADHLLTTLGIERRSLPQSVLNLLYSGGRMGGGRAPGDEITFGHAIKRLYPSLDLLGGSVDAFILPRSRLRMAAWIVASEYSHAIDAIFPHLRGVALPSASDLIGTEVRTRGTGSDSDGNQMLYSYETLAAGTQIAIEFIVDDWAPDATLAALARGIANWTGFVGGQGRQGRGRCSIEWLYTSPPTSDAYDVHVAEHAEQMRTGLTDGTLGTGKVMCS